MFREGYSVRVLESNTYEEANSDFVNWMKQRSRWFKGYLQTFAVHLREPRELRRELGWKGLMHFTMFVGGTPILAIINPIFWLMTLLWFVAHPAFIQEIFPAPVYYLGLRLVGLRELPAGVRHGDERPRGQEGRATHPGPAGPALLGHDVHGRGQGVESIGWRARPSGKRRCTDCTTTSKPNPLDADIAA